MVAGEESAVSMDTPDSGADMDMGNDNDELGDTSSSGLAGADAASGPIDSATGRELK